MGNKSPTLSHTDPAIQRSLDRVAAQENAMVSRTGKPVTGNISDLIRSAKYNFTLVFGTVYHLYKGPEGYVLSLTKYEKQDKYQFIGSYRLAAMDVWEKV